MKHPPPPESPGSKGTAASAVLVEVGLDGVATLLPVDVPPTPKSLKEWVT
ncbi:MAG: hypothetical protein HYY93_15940, partial [Planctomycetes bacterium]|nr:hypothetical protein [Planctomycetota bacterium]